MVTPTSTGGPVTASKLILSGVGGINMKTKSNSCPWPARPGPGRSARALSGPGWELYVYAMTTTFSPAMRNSNHLDLGQRADAQHVHCDSYVHGGACKRNHHITSNRSPGRRARESGHCAETSRYPWIDTSALVWVSQRFFACPCTSVTRNAALSLTCTLLT